MKIIQHCLFFIQQNSKQMRNKWFSLILLFFIPLFMLFSIFYLAVSFIKPLETTEIKLAIVDEDKTTESALLVELFELTVKDQDNVTLETMSHEQAYEQILKNTLTSYIVFPKNLTADLFAGKSITLKQFGNENQYYESIMIKELLENLSRYIESSQANILTTYEYAKKVNMPSDTYEEYRMVQFLSFTMSALAKNAFVSETEVINHVTSSPKHYFSIVALFILLSIWLVGLSLLLKQSIPNAITIRFRLLGVSNIQQVFARLFVVVVSTLILITPILFGLLFVLQIELYPVDYLRIYTYMALYSICYVVVIELLALLIASEKLAMFFQTISLFIILFCSGALLPSIYLPAAWEPFTTQFFGHNSLEWLITIIVEQQNYADYTVLLWNVSSLLVLYFIISVIKERRL